jgi:hypothetical protein
MVTSKNLALLVFKIPKCVCFTEGRALRNGLHVTLSAPFLQTSYPLSY